MDESIFLALAGIYNLVRIGFAYWKLFVFIRHLWRGCNWQRGW